MNLANAVTLLRLLLLIPTWFFIKREWRVSVGLFVLFIVLDIVDGRIARARNEASTFGAWLDLLTDGVGIVGTFLVLVILGNVPFALILGCIPAVVLAAWSIPRSTRTRKDLRFVNSKWKWAIGGASFLAIIALMTPYAARYTVVWVLIGIVTALRVEHLIAVERALARR